jgi:hypothetical protein
MYQSCQWSDIDYVITDRQPPDNILKQIELNDVELIIVSPEA